MKAVLFEKFGAPDVLRVETVDTPQPAPGHVQIKVLAAGVNRLDLYIREGKISADLPLPHVLGMDIAGEIAQTGDGVGEFTIGQRVIVTPGFPMDATDYDIYPASLAPSFTLPGLGRWGGYAQFIDIPARFVVADETGLSAEEAATLPVVLATSVRAVKHVGNVGRGDRVLVQAGASGSGSMQIQVAKALGAEVATTVRSPEKRAMVSALGADLILDPAETNVAEAVRDWTGGQGADVVIDNLGGDILAESIDAVRAAGAVVAYGFAAGATVQFDIRDLFFQQRKLIGTMAADPADLVWGLEQVAAGRIRPVLGRVLPLAGAAEAHRLLAENEIGGNVVLLPWEA